MATPISPRDAKAFAERWRLANEAERAELRAAPLDLKLRHLAALMASARALGWATTDPQEVEQVRARWLKLIEHDAHP